MARSRAEAIAGARGEGEVCLAVCLGRCVGTAAGGRLRGPKLCRRGNNPAVPTRVALPQEKESKLDPVLIDADRRLRAQAGSLARNGPSKPRTGSKVTRTGHNSQHQARPNMQCNTRSTSPGVSVARHAEVFVVAAAAAGVGELQRKHHEAASMSWTTGEIGIGGSEQQRKLPVWIKKKKKGGYKRALSRSRLFGRARSTSLSYPRVQLAVEKGE